MGATSVHVIAVAFVVAIAPAPARADSRVADAQRAYDELRFGDVLPAIAAARRSPLSREDQIELTRLEAYTYAVFEDAPHAVDAFRHLRALDPSFEPRNVSPKIRGYFEEARRTPEPPPAAPVAPPPPPRPAHSLVRSPWLWGGATVLAAVVGAGLWLTLRGDDEHTGNLGALRLP